MQEPSEEHERDNRGISKWVSDGRPTVFIQPAVVGAWHSISLGYLECALDNEWLIMMRDNAVWCAKADSPV